jgi:hypothetical protein
MRWQAETGVPASMIGGGDFIEPDADGQATSYIFHRLPTASYLTALWLGYHGWWPPSQAQIAQDLAYWQLSAIVAPAAQDSPLARFLTKEFGPPTVQIGGVLAWRQPHQILTKKGT